MINAIIYGNNIYSWNLYNFIEQGYNKVVEEFGGEAINIIAYLGFGIIKSNEVDGIAIIDIDKSRALVQEGIAEVLLVASENYSGQNDYLTNFISIGIGLENIYFAKKIEGNTFTKESIMDMLVPYYSYRKLPYLEFHIADHCNLNCAYCEHYSGLVKESVFPDFEKFSCDLRQLKKFIDDIGLIRILGGEPLLNPQIEDYLRLVSEVYPDSAIHVVTNALLLEKIPDSFFDTLRRCCKGSGIWISLYPVMQSRIDEIRRFLDSKKVSYGISEMMETFRKQQKLERSDDEATIGKYAGCFQKGCNNLYDGKIAACFLPFTTKYFNGYFNQHLPEDGAVDLYEEGMTTEIIRKQISEPFERCRYCMEAVNEKWHTIHNPSILEDWV